MSHDGVDVDIARVRLVCKLSEVGVLRAENQQRYTETQPAPSSTYVSTKPEHKSKIQLRKRYTHYTGTAHYTSSDYGSHDHVVRACTPAARIPMSIDLLIPRQRCG